LKLSLRTSETVNLEKVRCLQSIIEKKLENNNEKIQNLESDELNDFHKILQICEFILEKYENKKTLSQNLKRFVKIIDSTLVNLELVDDEVKELEVSANFSMNKIKEFQSNLIKFND
jgi:alanyl-tRNA synthetase